MDYKMLIGGRLIDGAARRAILNPATETVVADAPLASPAQLEAAVDAAFEACESWAATEMRKRASALSAIADRMEGRSSEFANLLTAEQGKPLGQAIWEVHGAIGVLRYFASLDMSAHIYQDNPESRIIEHRAPLGVVAAIVPWNFPLILAMAKLAPAILAGNTVVLKPAPTTPLTALLLGAAAAPLLPAGVLNVIADNNDLGSKLTAHPKVAKIAFTGSTATGRKVMANAAESIKRLTLELGGNDAAIVMEDFEPRLAARKLFDGAMMNAGQVCLAIKRAYVPSSMYEEVCAELAKLADEAVVGDGMDPATEIGPIQNEAQFNKLLRLIEISRTEGVIVSGGTVERRPGYFIRPTIVRDISDDSSIVREEQFGPILPVLSYTDIEDVIRRANASDYGLGGTIWSVDIERASSVAERIHSGVVWINKHMDLPLGVPVGGAKQSGLGTEFGVDSIKEYTQLKVINMAYTA